MDSNHFAASYAADCSDVEPGTRFFGAAKTDRSEFTVDDRARVAVRSHPHRPPAAGDGR